MVRQGVKDRLCSRERMALALAHQEADRIPRTEAFWPETIPTWHTQGLDVGADIRRMFDFDFLSAGWVRHDARPGYLEIVEESDEWQTRLDGNGAVLRYWRHKSGTPEHVAFTVRGPDEWRDLMGDLLRVPIEVRVDAYTVLAAMYRAQAERRWFCWGGVECFEIAKDIVGHETLCIAMAEDPDWAVEIFETETDIAIAALDYLERCGVRFDGGFLFGDIAYNHGPFCSPKMYRELVQPCHERHVAWFKDRGLPVIYHTDGDFRPLIPGFIEAGIDCLQPLEAKANIDVRDLKPKWADKLSFFGNIDATILNSNDRVAIEAEVASKLTAAKKGGGYICHSDHSVPPGVHWETFQYFMALVDEYGRYD